MGEAGGMFTLGERSWGVSSDRAVSEPRVLLSPRVENVCLTPTLSHHRQKRGDGQTND